MSIFGLPLLLFSLGAGKNPFLTPDKKWSDETGKVFDIEEPDA